MNGTLNRELANEYYRLAPMGTASVYGLLAVVLYFYWGELPHSILLPWAAVIFVTSTFFLIAIRLYKRHGTENNAGKWLNVYMFVVAAHDVPWGLIGPMSFMIDNEVYRMLTLFMLAGMTAGGIITRGVMFRIYVVSITALLTPIVITLAVQDTSITDAMLALVVIFIFFMLAVAKSYSATVKRNIQLWLDNAKLIDQLTESSHEVEKANRELTAEIEHRKKFEKELVAAKERSERASEAKNQFLANVSHELRTPLNGIIGFSELLQGELLDKKQAQYAAQIGKSGQSLLRIVNDILDITAIEAGHPALYKGNFFLRDELNDVVDILRHAAEHKSLELKLAVDEDVEDGLYGDANRLRQIIGNLINNAVKYTEEGRIEVRVSRQGERDERIVVRFDVDDTGIGVAEEALDSIFDRFTRVEGFNARKSEGVGLGLAIVKSLVQRMDGTITVRSRPGEGSSFCLEIPFAKSVGESKKTEKLEAVKLTPAQWQGFKVLIVDDNEVNRTVLAAFLAKAGISYSQADSGRRALESIRNGDFDLVLMDIQMPDMSGTEVAVRLREEQAELPVLIAVTAHAFPEQRQVILESGFDDFLIKPVSEADLLKTLTRASMNGYEQVRKKASGGAK